MAASKPTSWLFWDSHILSHLSGGNKDLNKTCERAAQRLRVLIDEANAIANGEALADRTDPDALGDVGGQAAIDALFGTR